MARAESQFDPDGTDGYIRSVRDRGDGDNGFHIVLGLPVVIVDGVA
jgi:hypothetical protein